MAIISSTMVSLTFDGVGSSYVPFLHVQIEYMQLKTIVTMFQPQLTQQSVGSTLKLNAGQPFQQAVDYFTDGVGGFDGMLWFYGGPGEGPMFWNKLDFAGGHSLNGVDLNGITIDEFDLTIDDFEVLPPIQAGMPNRYSVTVTFVVRGDLPPPPPPSHRGPFGPWPSMGVRVILGGNDGILIEIDANGHIIVLPPEGPGDPEIRAALQSIFEAAEVIAKRSYARSPAAHLGREAKKELVEIKKRAAKRKRKAPAKPTTSRTGRRTSTRRKKD